MLRSPRIMQTHGLWGPLSSYHVLYTMQNTPKPACDCRSLACGRFVLLLDRPVHNLITILGFGARTGEEHRTHAFEYQGLPPSEQKAFFDKHSTRFSEFCRLPYFNPVTMSVINPMHNILLGKHGCYPSFESLTFFPQVLSKHNGTTVGSRVRVFAKEQRLDQWAS